MVVFGSCFIDCLTYLATRITIPGLEDLNTLNHNCLAACDAAILTGSQTGEARGT